MSELKVTGEVKQILKPESGTSKAGKEWNKQDFVIETEDQYPKLNAFTLFGEKVSLCPKVGENVEVFFNFESREYNGRWFHNITAWRVELLSQKETNEPQHEVSETKSVSEENGDDLPF